MKYNLNKVVIILLSATALATAFVNCSVQTPQVTNQNSLSANSVNHVQGVTSCAGCHESTRPTYLTKTSINLSLSSHFTGNDCYLCHTYANLSWTPFVHQNADGKKAGTDSTAATVVDCNTCHIQNRPATISTGAAHVTTGSCGSCHTIPNASVNPLPGWKIGAGTSSDPHTPVPASCVACHSADKPTTTVPSLADGFDHNARWGADCKTCHTKNIGVSFNPGYFDHGSNGSIVKAVTCSPCHDQKHHYSGRLCSQCHNPTYPTAGSAGAWDKP
ncbi:MAG: hypothetical protein ACXVAX_02520 [Pseudobdellovibrio sp.]